MSISSNSFNYHNIHDFLQKLPGVDEADSQASELERMVPKEGDEKAQESSGRQSDGHVKMKLTDRTITLTPTKVSGGVDLRVEIKTSSLAKVIFVALSVITGGLFVIASLVWNAPRDYLWGRTWTQKFTDPASSATNQVAQQAIPNAATNPSSITPQVDDPQARSEFYAKVTDEKLRSELLRDGFLADFEPDYAKAQAKPLDVGNYIVTNLSQDEIVKYGQFRPMAKFDFRYNNNGRETTFKVSYIDNRYSFDLNPFALYSNTSQNLLGSCQHLNEIPDRVDAMLKKMKSIQS